MARKLTFEEIVEELKIKNPTITPISTFIKNSECWVKYICSCGNEYETRYQNIKLGHKCIDCRNKTIGESKMPDFKNLKKEIETINPKITIIDRFRNKGGRWACHYICDCQEINEKAIDKLKMGQMCKKCSNKATGERQTPEIEDVKNLIKNINPNIDILSREHLVKGKKGYSYHCKCLIDDFEWWCLLGDLKKGHGCPNCANRNMRGDKSKIWKGGITPLKVHLRQHIFSWRNDSFNAYNSLCDINGIKNKTNVIHHAHKGFSDIIYETLKLLNLKPYSDISKYSHDELLKIGDLFLELHYKYGFGICLTREEHNKFHSMYGKKNNNIGQYEEFKKFRLYQISIPN